MGVYRPASRYGARRPARRASKRPAMRRPRSNIVTVPRTLTSSGGFPEKMITTLRYTDILNVSNSGGVTGKSFRLNSLYDPNATDLGHQPAYFDQYSLIYAKYRVISSTIKVTFSPASSDTEITADGPWCVGITANSSGNFPTNIQTLCEQNRTVSSMLTRDSGTALARHQLTYQPKRDMGIAPDEDTLSATTGNNPDDQYLAYVFISNVPTANTTQVIFKVDIEYKCMFFKQSEIGSS